MLIPCLAIAETILISAVIWQFQYKSFPLWVYFIIVVLFALCVTTLILLLLKQNKYSWCVFQIFLVGFLVRIVLNVATNFSVLPGGDPYWELAVMKQFIQQGHISVINESTYLGDTLQMYSSFPGLHILGMYVTEITGINPVSVAILVPIGFFISWFLLCIAFVHKLGQTFSKKVPIMALLVIATSPFAFLPLVFWHQDLAVLFVLLVFYLLYEYIQKPSSELTLLILAVMVSLILTHHYSSLVTIAYLIVISVTYIITKLMSHSSRMGREIRQRLVPIELAMISMTILFIWWDYVATVIWPWASSIGSKTIQMLKSMQVPSLALGEASAGYPTGLVPLWLIRLLEFRDAILALLTVFAVIFILNGFRKEQKINNRLFILLSLFIAGLFFVCLIEANVAAYRILPLFLPFAAMCIGVSLALLKKPSIIENPVVQLEQTFINNRFKDKRLWHDGLRMIALPIQAIIMSLFIFTALTGLWGSNFAPVHLYDPNVTFNEVGEHSPEYGRLQNYIQGHFDINNIGVIITDDVQIMSLMVPVEDISKIIPIGLKTTQLGQPIMVVELRGFNPSPYIAQGEPDIFDPNFNVNTFINGLDQNNNLVYSDNNYAIWLR